MGVILNAPKFPVIDPNPSASKTVSNFNFDDLVKLTTLTSGATAFGYIAGVSSNIRGPSMYVGGLLGLMGGFMYAYQCSAFRLMGFLPNDDEVESHRRL